MPTIWRGLLATAITLAAVSSAASQTSGELRSLTIAVGSSPGGGYDTYARILSRHISRHLSGQPGIVVQNMPGASSLKAVQYLDAGAPSEGSAIAAFRLTCV